MQSWKSLTTDQRIDAIKAIYANTIGTAQAMSEALTEQYGEKISRSSVISYYHRHSDKMTGMPLLGRPPARDKSAPAPKPKIKRPSMLLASTGNHFAAPEQRKPPTPVIPTVVSIPVPDPLLLRLFELERANCRWPVQGERENTLFCGNDTVEGSSYCACHKAMSVGRGSRAEREAIPPMRKAA